MMHGSFRKIHNIGIMLGQWAYYKVTKILKTILLWDLILHCIKLLRLLH